MLSKINIVGNCMLEIPFALLKCTWEFFDKNFTGGLVTHLYMYFLSPKEHLTWGDQTAGLRDL